jgi:hypothetical protein
MGIAKDDNMNADAEYVSEILALAERENETLITWAIATDSDANIAAELLQDVKERARQLETRRRAITVPLYNAQRSINDLFRKPADLFNLMERTIKGKLADYQDSLKERNTEALAKVRNAGSVDEAQEALSELVDVSLPSSVSIRHKWVPHVHNVALLDRRFLRPDMKKIKTWMKEYTDERGAPAPIPGIRFEQVPVVASRKKK